jgi:hypothetical protein
MSWTNDELDANINTRNQFVKHLSRTIMNKTLMNIAAVERETGLGKDTLRVWERRYGFPSGGNMATRYPRW